MNTELRAMIVAAEGRYLSTKEVDSLRDYASGMDGRLAAARRMQAAEETILTRARQRLGDLDRLHAGRSEGIEEMRFMLRRIALAHVRSDLDHFREAHAEWVAEQLCNMLDPAALTTTFEAVREAMGETLEEVDTYAFEPYLHTFIEELRKWQAAS